MDIRSINPEIAPIAFVEQPLTPREAAERRELVHAVRAINKAEAVGDNNELSYTIDRQTRKAILRIVNRETGEVVRQIPSEEVLRLAQSLG